MIGFMVGGIIFILCIIGLVCKKCDENIETGEELQDSQEEPIEVEKDISEPVISFVETVLTDPKRFKVEVLLDDWTNGVSTKGYCLHDKIHNLHYVYTYQEFYYPSIEKACFIDVIDRTSRWWNWLDSEKLPETVEDLSFLTKDELEYLKEKLFPLQEEVLERAKRLEFLLEYKVSRKQRNRLKKLYCKEN